MLTRKSENLKDIKLVTSVGLPLRASDRTAGTDDALLMSWQQPCTSPTTHAGF